jgi:hypothetical protein
MHRATNLIVGTAAILLGAAAVAFALTSGPQQTPSATDLPRIVTAASVASATPPAPAVSVSPTPAKPRVQGRSSGPVRTPSAPQPSTQPAPEVHHPDEQPSHETVTPPVHESDGNKHTKEQKSD